MSTFAELSQKSVSCPRVLFELNRTQFNDQWVNYGAGVWEVDFNCLYPFVDPDLLEGFTEQSFGDIGQITIDNVSIARADSLLDLCNTLETAWWYDTVYDILYIRFPYSDEPWLHTTQIGVIMGYSFEEFTPPGADRVYEGRIRTIPNLRKSRDPLYFSRLSFEGGTVELSNVDGEFDQIAEEGYIYGNVARILFGYEELDYSDYVVLFTGYIGLCKISETSFTLEVKDKRRQLTKYLASYSCSATNALDAIVDILQTGYPDIEFTTDYFDTTAWNAAQALAPVITMNWSTPKSVIALIEDVCVSIFGIFDTNVDGKFTFKYVGGTPSYTETIGDEDIMSTPKIVYDPTEVISNIRVGYAKDWATTGDSYTHTYNNDYEDEVFEKYKTYNQQNFDTMLVYLSSATALAETIINYVKDVHGQCDIRVPMMYYDTEVGDNVYAELNRENSTMLGTKGVEILSKTYKLDGVPSIILGLRIN